MMPIGYGKEFRFCGEDEICSVLEGAYGEMTPITEKYGKVRVIITKSLIFREKSVLSVQ